MESPPQAPIIVPLVFLHFVRKLRKLTPQQILFNMALSMLVSWVVFLAGFTRTGDYLLCLWVAVLLHYFILASFMWMLMEGLLQYLMLVKVLHVIGDRFIQKVALTAWGQLVGLSVGTCGQQYDYCTLIVCYFLAVLLKGIVFHDSVML